MIEVPYQIVSRYSAIGVNSKLEHGVIVEENVLIGGDCFIGYYSIIRPNVRIW